jgi:hypothetical protein
LTAVGTAGLLALIVLAAAPGSLQVLRDPMSAPTIRRSPALRWAIACLDGRVRVDRRRLDFCGRISGRVVWVTHGPDPGESHVAVLGGFHLILVKPPEGARPPGWGTSVVAIGPLVRSRSGMLELQSLQMRR